MSEREWKKVVDGETINMTQEEIEDVVRREREWLTEQLLSEVKNKIAALESGITPRRQREAGTDDAGGTAEGRAWMAAKQAEIQALRDNLK